MKFALSLLVSLLIPLSVWSQDPITVLYPNGGETFRIGDTIYLKWESDTINFSPYINTVNLQLSIDGKKFLSIQSRSVTMASPQWGNFFWVVPDSLNGVSTVSSTCLFKVHQYGNASVGDESDSYFSIHHPVAPEEPKNSGGACGTGAGLALIPLLFCRFRKGKFR